jgi:mRNA export factor
MDSRQQDNAVQNDYGITDQIEDTIQVLKFNPNKNSQLLSSCGWDNKVRVWNINYQITQQMNNTAATIQASPATVIPFDDALISLCWQPDTRIFTGSVNGNIHAIDASTGQSGIMGKHENGVKEVVWNSNHNIVISGGWDCMLHFWDLRQQMPALSLNVGKKVYSMSLTYPLLVIGLDNRQVIYFNLNKLGGMDFKPEATFESHLRYQTRKVATFLPDGTGYAIGSIEGRVAIKHIDLNKIPQIDENTKQMTAPDDFAFRCHRMGDNMSEVYPLNDIAFNPAYGTFCTAGGDGSWIIWDKDSRSRLKLGYHQNRAPMTAIDYSANGDLLAYASGYDWAKGINYDGSFPTKLNIHYCPDSDKKKKPKQTR